MSECRTELGVDRAVCSPITFPKPRQSGLGMAEVQGLSEAGASYTCVQSLLESLGPEANNRNS